MNPQDPTQIPAAPMPSAGQPYQLPEQPAQPTQTAEEPKEKHAIRNPLSSMQPGETMICEIKRHPIGMLGVYIGAGFLLIVLALLAFGVAPAVITTASKSEVYGLGAVIYIVFAALCLGFVAISNKVYWGNSWVVTSDSITQITQTSLFHKQSSQLSLGNLEDVTADQAGPISHMFNFGVLKVETAGERSKFMFLYCPNPNYYAQQILSARERFEQGRRAEDQRLYRGPVDQQVPQQPVYATPAAQPLPSDPYAQPQPTAQQAYGLPQYPPTESQASNQTPPSFPADPAVAPPAQSPYQGYQFPSTTDDTPSVNVDTQS